MVCPIMLLQRVQHACSLPARQAPGGVQAVQNAVPCGVLHAAVHPEKDAGCHDPPVHQQATDGSANWMISRDYACERCPTEQKEEEEQEQKQEKEEEEQPFKKAYFLATKKSFDDDVFYLFFQKKK